MEAMLHKNRPEGVVGQDLIIRGNTTPLPGSRGTGEILSDGRSVLKVLGHLDASGNYVKRAFKRVLQRDPDGTILYHIRPDGTRRAPQWALEPVEPVWVEYVIDDVGNGITKINTHFRESDEYLARQAREANRDRQLNRLLQALEESNLSAEDVVRAIRGMPPVDEVVVPDSTPAPPPPPAGAERMAAANAARTRKRQEREGGGEFLRPNDGPIEP